MITFAIDFFYVLAALMAAIYFKAGNLTLLANAVSAYALLAVLFQFFVHIAIPIIKTITKFTISKPAWIARIKELPFLQNLLAIMLSFIIAFLITTKLIPFP